MSDPASPNSDDENEMPMPPSGAGQTFLERVEDRIGVAADIEVVDDAADRADRLDQAPERAEQPEEDEEAGQIAGNVARLVEAVGQRIEKGAHGLRRNGDAADAFAAEDRGHRRKQRRRSRPRAPGSARRKLLTQETSGNSRMTRMNDRMMPISSTGRGSGR